MVIDPGSATVYPLNTCSEAVYIQVVTSPVMRSSSAAPGTASPPAHAPCSTSACRSPETCGTADAGAADNPTTPATVNATAINHRTTRVRPATMPRSLPGVAVGSHPQL